MLRLNEEQDVERLRQAALLLEAENRRLTSRVLELTRALMTARGDEATALQLRLAELEQQLARAKSELYGRSSEKTPRANAKAKGEKTPQSGHGPREQKQLPTEERVHLLDEPDQQCPSCGGELQAMEGCFEEADEVDVVERRFVLVKHRRQKYRCRCNACVETAPGPEKLVAGGRYSLDFAIEVAVQKYLDHLPLERQVRVMKREGLRVDSQTLWDQVSALAKALQPAYEALWAHQLEHGVLGVDETRWPLFGSEKASRWHAWALATEKAVAYRILEGRGADAAREVLRGYRGKVMADGYKVYEALRRRDGNFELAHCWAHVRRKFHECVEHYPEAQKAVDLIGELYTVEREAASTGPPSIVTLQRLRREKSRPILDRIHAWALEQRSLPETAFGRALTYMGGLWNGLTRFVDDPQLPLDNNATERALRGVVVGRKNHYGSKSRRGTEVAAVLYSLLETCKIVDLEPKAYLRAAALAQLRGQAPVLPHHVAGAAPVE